MRTIGVKTVGSFEFKLENNDTVYKVPFAADLPYSVLQQIRETVNTDDRFPAQVEMLRKYMGDVVDDLSAGTLSEILTAWGEESMEAGASVGES